MVEFEVCELSASNAQLVLEQECDIHCASGACGSVVSCDCSEPVDTGTECEREGVGAGLTAEWLDQPQMPSTAQRIACALGQAE